MNSHTTITLRKILPLALFAAALPVFAGGGDDPLAWVPAGASAVGSVRLRDLKTSPITRQVFEHLDKMTVKGDAARFMEDAGLRPIEDVDSITLAGGPRDSATGHETGLIIFTGRFDADRLARAVRSRGADSVTDGTAVYFRLIDKHQGDKFRDDDSDDAKDAKKAKRRGGEPGAVAFLSSHTIIAGAESSVLSAIRTHAAGGSGFAAGTLGREMNRISPDATAWALVDVSRFTKQERKNDDAPDEPRRHGDGRPEGQVLSAMKSVSVLTAQTTVSNDRVSFSITGLCPEEETRGLIEDTLRGLLAGWRLAVQDKEPELVSVIRRFQVSHNSEGVTLTGIVPGEVIEHFKEKMKQHEKERKVAEKREATTK